MKTQLFRLILAFLFLYPCAGQSQDPVKAIAATEAEIAMLNRRIDSLQLKLESYKFQKLKVDLDRYGLPAVKAGEEVVYHNAYALVYDEEHEQAKWVSHIILTDVKRGNEGRSNDFRPDEKIKTGSAVEADYFLKTVGPDSVVKYDAFGYDRGHLAPSADFRYSKKALSESYYYSNMTPQVALLNRGRWAELEDMMRQYVIRNNIQLYVTTGPILKQDLKKITRSVNNVSIPEQFFKVIIDLETKKGIGFIMPNRECEYPVFQYACSIDSIERLTGLDFFTGVDDNLEAQLESRFNAAEWMTEREAGDALPLRPDSLPRNTFNTVQAKNYIGSNETIKVCGTVVGTRLSSKGNIFLNLDKRFPNQIFTITIFKDHVANFSYTPDKYLEGRRICVTGKVTNYNGTPSVSITDEKAIEILDP